MSATRLLFWGNYPPFPQIPTPCHWRGELQEGLSTAQKQHGTTLAYGAGLSYGDSCLAVSDHVLLMRPLDRFLSTDWAVGVGMERRIDLLYAPVFWARIMLVIRNIPRALFKRMEL